MLKNDIVIEDMSRMDQSYINYERLKNKSVLVTGATGMLASYYVGFLMYLNSRYDYHIKIYTLARNLEKLQKVLGAKNCAGVIPVIQDVTAPIKIDGPVDFIVHMASSANPSTLSVNPIGVIEANLLGTRNVLELAKEKGAEILFTSTREIYGKMPEDQLEIKENEMGVLDCTEVRSCYPESKRMAENMIVCYSNQCQVPFKIARLAHSYGPGMIIYHDGRIMADLLSNVLDNSDIILKSTGEAKRAFCYVSDAVSALFAITCSDKSNEIYNVSNETEEIAIRDLAFQLVEMYPEKGLQVQFQIQENQNQYVKFARTKLNNDKLYALGWHPQVSLTDGIARTLKYFEEEK